MVKRDMWRGYDKWRTESPEDRDERIREQNAKPDPDDEADRQDAREAREEQEQ